MPKRSYTEKELLYAIKESSYMSQVLIKLGLCKTGTSRNIIKNYVVKNNIDISHWVTYKPTFNKTAIPLSEILKDNTRFNTNNLKNRLIKQNILEYKCSECGITTWNNKPISLHLDHINGINTDNRLENLRIICPNCHSQTPTYGGKNHSRYKKTWFCENCNKQVSKKQKICFDCYNKNKKTKIDWPSVDVLKEKLKTQSRVSLAKELGVSDNAIKKRILRGD